MKDAVKGLVVLFICGMFSTVDAQPSNRRDGNWWRSQDSATRVAYMVGFFDGMDLGYRFSYWKYVGVKSAADHLVKANDSYNEYSSRFFKNVTNGQLVDGLDTFYSDYRNRSIRASDAVWLVVNEIAGTPRAQLDTMIENWRKAATK